MKTLVLVLFSFALFAGVYGIQADYTPPSDVILLDKDDDKKTEVKYADLPQAVKDALNRDDYRGWVVDETAHLVTKKDGQDEYYKITLKKPDGHETKTVKLDREGNLFEHDRVRME
jgi:hypothetical protein